VTEDTVNGEQLSVNGKGRGPVYRLPFTVYAFLSICAHPLVAQIQDNSFLLEEAYNQERGVVQHISALRRFHGGNWVYGFTQEWPLGGIRHQLSYTVPFQSAEGSGTGLGDVGLNYRYQLVGHPAARTVMAPRFTLLLPTGNEERGRGAGGVGLQANLPLTMVLSPEFVFHGNAGITVTPAARDMFGAQATTVSRNLGASAIWLLRPSFNLLLEVVWLSEESVAGEGSSRRDEVTLVNPGIRAAFDMTGDLQIVPGIAYTIGLSPDSAEDGIFLYLSFEHPFKR
jgi:hypothetical protein